jgi:hypothetical protein
MANIWIKIIEIIRIHMLSSITFFSNIVLFMR